MNKSPKPIRRLGPSGPQEIAPVEQFSEHQIYNACIILGQSQESAKQSVIDFQEQMIDPNDSKLIIDTIRLEKIPEKIIETQLIKPSLVNPTRINPRDPKQGLNKAKRTIRDPITGLVTGIVDVP